MSKFATPGPSSLVDPYHAVQQEIQTSLQAASQLHSSFLRIRSMARPESEELMWARNELKATLATLEADLEDLEESVKIVESTDARMFGLDETEVSKRRRYVGHVRKEIENMRVSVNSTNATSGPSQSRYLNSSGPESTPLTPLAEDHQAAWAQEEQQMMIRDQDQTIESIAGTLTTIAQQAGLMGQEINEHNELLTDLEGNVDTSDTKLNDAMRRMRKFLRDSEERGSSWCIIILMIILMILLLVVILV